VLSPTVLRLASLVATRDLGSTVITLQRCQNEAILSQSSQGRSPSLRPWRLRISRIKVAIMADEPQQKLQVQIDDDIAQGIYSNLVLLNHAENEFVLDFAFIQPSSGRAKVRARVISSPRHTKRLLVALQKNIERYEERYGTIDPGSDDEPMLH
jgi:Protein of unknown function (DUF3467)